MEMAPECIPCLLGRVLFESDLCAPKKEATAVRDSLKILGTEYVPGANSAEVATIVHRRVYDILRTDDPYRRLKDQANDIAMKLYPKAEQALLKAKDRFRTAVLISIAGNVMDFGIQGLDDPTAIIGQFDQLIQQGLDIDDLDEISGSLGPGKKVLYLMDNCGEIVLDRVLVREIKNTGSKVIGVVKGKPILTDATRDDLLKVGMFDIFDEILDTGVFAVGIDLDRMGDELREAIASSDLIISKGMANFESLSDSKIGPILFLLRAKCRPVADAIGAKKGDNVARIKERSA